MVGRPRTFPARMLGVLRLDGRVFDEVGHDPRAFGQALAVVVLAGLARGVAGFDRGGAVGLLASVIAGLLIWAASAGVVWAIGVRTFEYRAGAGELLRTLGFAATPLLALFVCALPVPLLAATLSLAAHALAILAFAIAVRQALGVSTERALVVCVLAVALSLALLFLLGILFSAGGRAG